jgi:hypothetical protein
MAKRKRYSEAALMQRVLDMAQEYLELRRLRVELERAEIQQKKRRKVSRRDDKRKR